MPIRLPTQRPTRLPTKDPTPAPTDRDPTAAPTPDAVPDPDGDTVVIVSIDPVDDAVETCAGDEVSTNVVFNDVPPADASLLVARIVTDGDDGTCAIAPWGVGQVVTYVPDPGFVGTDGCAYEACVDADGDGALGAAEAGGQCATATLTVAVADCAAADAPTATPTCDDPVVIANDDFYTTPKNTPVLLAPLANDVLEVPGTTTPDPVPDPGLADLPGLDLLDPLLNPDGLAVADPLLFAGRRGTCAFYASRDEDTGELSRSATLLWYTPEADFYGEDDCVYKACAVVDGASAPACDIATISITVSPSPGDPVANDDAVETPKDTPVDVYPLDNDEALADHPLVVTDILGDDSGAHGECVVASDEVVMYVPEPGYAGPDACRYRACDDRDRCDEATIAITVVGENDEPCENKNPTTAPAGGGVTWDTFGPTASPSTKPTKTPTPPPTNKPTIMPTPSPTTPAPTSCEGRRFYYTALAGCTNGDGRAPGAGTFETGEQCCVVNYPDPAEACRVTDVCAAAPTSSPTTPAPTSCEGRSFYYTASAGCTNEESTEPRGGLFETGEQCCVVNYPDPAEECRVTDVCEAAPDPTSSPVTSRPTPPPTRSPSASPTKKPTLSPTNKPTSSPTNAIPLDATPAPTVKPPTPSVETNTPTWGGTPTVGTDATAAPVKQRSDRLRKV